MLGVPVLGGWGAGQEGAVVTFPWLLDRLTSCLRVYFINDLSQSDLTHLSLQLNV